MACGPHTSTTGWGHVRETHRTHIHPQENMSGLVGSRCRSNLAIQDGLEPLVLRDDVHSQGKDVVNGRPTTSFMQGGYRPPTKMSALGEGPSIGLTTGLKV